MRERPILFSGDMVRAILEGQKTVTRREVVSRSRKRPFAVMVDNHPDFPGRLQPFQADEHGCISFEDKVTCEFPIYCPYGEVGDRLWVRESFLPAPLEAPPIDHQPSRWSICYQGGAQTERLAPAAYNPVLYNYERWTPGIHMPRWASRVVLEVTAIRLERLHDITPEQALAEGVMSCQADLDPDGTDYSPYELFSILWVTIYGHDSWCATPWVWVVEFKVVPHG